MLIDDKHPILVRVPPGDNWAPDNSELRDTPIFQSLTEALTWAFKSYKAKEFHVSAAQGKVYMMVEDSSIEETKKKEKGLEQDIEDLYGDK